MGLSIARFPFVRQLGSFDCAAQLAVGPRQMRELATGRFVASGEAVLLLGPPSVGKTHLAVAIGREVILAGYTVPFVTAPDQPPNTTRNCRSFTSSRSSDRSANAASISRPALFIAVSETLAASRSPSVGSGL